MCDLEDTGRCAKCGKPHEWVRPGKTQPTCLCDITCSRCGGLWEFHVEPNPKWPRVSGWFCPVCGPEHTWKEEEL